MVLNCIVLRSWLRRAGCVSQDAYILHNIEIGYDGGVGVEDVGDAKREEEEL